MKAYIASSSMFEEECEELSKFLKGFGISVTRKWWRFHKTDALDLSGLPDIDFYNHYQVQFIREADFRAIREADMVIVIAHYPEKALTGSLIEVGYAIAQNKIVIFMGRMKRCTMASGCIHIKRKAELEQLIRRIW